MWEAPAIQVIGFPWCKDEAKTVGVSSLTAKILCRTHNTALSDVDAAGAAAFAVLQRSAQLQDRRQKEPPRKRWKLVRFEIDGWRLERWYLKTLINLGVSNATSGTWAISGTPLDEPPKQFVEAAYGIGRLEPPLGLYGVAAIGEHIVPNNAVEVQTLLKLNGMLAGALFTFLGFRFFLNLEHGQVPRSTQLPAGKNWIDSGLLYHIVKIENKVRKKHSHYIHFLYNVA